MAQIRGPRRTTTPATTSTTRRPATSGAPGAESGGGSHPATNPGGGRGATGRAALLFPSLIVRTWHHRPGRGPVRPDKETP